ncbi:MAG: hypothetical protein AAGI90_02620 [Chlamydiota bacterium]
MSFTQGTRTSAPISTMHPIDQVQQLRNAAEITDYVDKFLLKHCRITEVFLNLLDKLPSLSSAEALPILNRIRALKTRSQGFRKSSENTRIGQAIEKTSIFFNQTRTKEIDLIGATAFYSTKLQEIHSSYENLLSQDKQVTNTLSTLKQARIVATMEHFAIQIDHATCSIHAYLKKNYAEEMKKLCYYMQNSIQSIAPFKDCVLGGGPLNEVQINRVLQLKSSAENAINSCHKYLNFWQKQQEALMKKMAPTLQSLQQAVARAQSTSMQQQSVQRDTIDLEPIVDAYFQRLKNIEWNFENLQTEHVAMEKTWAILTKLNGKPPPKKIGEHLNSHPIAHMGSLLRSAIFIISNLNQLNQSAQPRQFDEQQVHRFIKLASDRCKNCDDFLTFWSEKLQQCHVETLNHMKSKRYNHSTPYTLTTVVFPNGRQEAKESKNTVASKSAANAFFSAPIPDKKCNNKQ